MNGAIEVGVLETILEIPENHVFVVRNGDAGSPHSGCEELCDLGGSHAPADDGSRDRRLG